METISSTVKHAAGGVALQQNILEVMFHPSGQMCE